MRRARPACRRCPWATRSRSRRGRSSPCATKNTCWRPIHSASGPSIPSCTLPMAGEASGGPWLHPDWIPALCSGPAADWQTAPMSNVLVLGAGWVGAAVAAAADGHGGRRLGARPRPAVRAGAGSGAIPQRPSTSVRIVADGDIRGCRQLLRSGAGHRRRARRCEPPLRRVALRRTRRHRGSAGPRRLRLGVRRSRHRPTRCARPLHRDRSARTRRRRPRAPEVVLDARARGLDATVARVFNIVGHPVPTVSPIHQWLTDLQALGDDGGEVVVWWPPTTRDFVMIEDVATGPGRPGAHTRTRCRRWSTSAPGSG